MPPTGSRRLPAVALVFCLLGHVPSGGSGAAFPACGSPAPLELRERIQAEALTPPAGWFRRAVYGVSSLAKSLASDLLAAMSATDPLPFAAGGRSSAPSIDSWIPAPAQRPLWSLDLRPTAGSMVPQAAIHGTPLDAVPVPQDLAQMPAWSILETLGLLPDDRSEHAARTQQIVRQADGTIVRSVTIPHGRTSQPATGVRLLSSELSQSSLVFYVLYSEEGYPLGVVPQPTESQQVEMTRRDRPDADEPTTLRYLDLTPYLFAMLSLNDPQAAPAWDQFVRQRRLYRDRLGSFMGTALNTWIRPVDGETTPPYQWAQADPRTGELQVMGFHPLLGIPNPYRMAAVAAQKNSRLRQLIFPRFPTVFAPQLGSDYKYHSRVFVGEAHRGTPADPLALAPHHQVWLMGPGSGFDTWLVSLVVRRKIWVNGINPFEVANVRYTARLAGFEVDAQLSDGVIGPDGKLLFKGPVDRFVWNSRSVTRMASLDGRQANRMSGRLQQLHDGDLDGKSLRRLAPALPSLLGAAGTGMLWIGDDIAFAQEILETQPLTIENLEEEHPAIWSDDDGVIIRGMPSAVFLLRGAADSKAEDSLRRSVARIGHQIENRDLDWGENFEALRSGISDGSRLLLERAILEAASNIDPERGAEAPLQRSLTQNHPFGSLVALAYGILEKLPALEEREAAALFDELDAVLELYNSRSEEFSVNARKLSVVWLFSFAVSPLAEVRRMPGLDWHLFELVTVFEHVPPRFRRELFRFHQRQQAAHVISGEEALQREHIDVPLFLFLSEWVLDDLLARLDDPEDATARALFAQSLDAYLDFPEVLELAVSKDLSRLKTWRKEAQTLEQGARYPLFALGNILLGTKWIAADLDAPVDRALADPYSEAGQESVLRAYNAFGIRLGQEDEWRQIAALSAKRFDGIEGEWRCVGIACAMAVELLERARGDDRFEIAGVLRRALKTDSPEAALVMEIAVAAAQTLGQSSDVSPSVDSLVRRVWDWVLRPPLEVLERAQQALTVQETILAGLPQAGEESALQRKSVLESDLPDMMPVELRTAIDEARRLKPQPSVPEGAMNVGRYVEPIAVVLAHEIRNAGGRVWKSNAFGPGYLGLWWIDRTGRRIFTPLSPIDFRVRELESPYREGFPVSERLRARILTGA